MKNIFEFLKSRKIKPKIDKILPVDVINRAHKILQAGKIQEQIVINN
jgi:D-arabinose 1-dehydrogenase-like Zn-dependent alcohol dehydrogenase